VKRPPIWIAFFLVPFAIAFVGKTLAAFASIIQAHLAIQYDLWFEIGMVTGQVLFQWLFMLRRTWDERRDYALILFFVSTLGALLLWPLLLWNRESVPIALGWFFTVVGIMFAVHWVLVARRGLPKLLCVTWVLYRVLLLFIIVKRP